MDFTVQELKKVALELRLPDGAKAVQSVVFKTEPERDWLDAFLGVQGTFLAVGREIVLYLSAQCASHTMFHEMCHALLHGDKLLTAAYYAPEFRRVAEEQADYVAEIVCNAFGVDASKQKFRQPHPRQANELADAERAAEHIIATVAQVCCATPSHRSQAAKVAA